MSAPFGGEPLPEELIALASEFGISPEEIAVVHQIIQLTPELEATAIAANGQPLGNGSIRAAREYDHQASSEEEGKSLIVVEAPEAGVQFAFLVNRQALATALSIEVPSVSAS